MLVLRSHQRQMFRDVRRAQLARRVAAHLRDNHPDDILGPGEAELLELVAERLQRARDYGMTWESSLAAFACLTFTIAARFDEHPAVKKVLEDPDIPPNLRVEMLLAQLTDEEWEQASRLTSQYAAARRR